MDTKERDRLIQLIVGHVADYRQDEIPRVDAARVLGWLQQFEENDRLTLLIETERMLSKTYISRAKAKSFIEGLVTTEKLVGANPKEFWEAVGFLRLQSGSQSQTDTLALLNEVIAEKFGLNTACQDSTSNAYVYLDDVAFSGNQIKNDLLQWAKDKNIRNATVHIIVMGVYTYGEYYAKRELKKEFDERKISLHFWASARLENSPGRIADAQVLWPSQLPDEQYVKQWEATLAPHKDNLRPDRLTERRAQLYFRRK